MPAIPAVVFFVALLLCSFLGRVLLVNAAFGVSTGWGFTVLFVPFGPLFFGMKYRDLAYPTRYWRWATAPLTVLFFANGGATMPFPSFTDLMNLGKRAVSATTTAAAAGDTHFHLPVPGKVVAALGHTDPMAEAGIATSSTPKPTATPPATVAPTAAASAPAATPAATPSKAVAAAASTMPEAPKLLSPAERFEANRRECERLAEWYDNLKHERGYLRKGDTEAVEAYNVEAAKYQAALQLAKNEQAELAKLTAKK